MIKYLIFGGGFMGRKLAGYLADAHLSDARIASAASVVQEIHLHKPEWVINCVGKTGVPNVDWCESHKAETLFANTTVPMLILEGCHQTGVKLMHLGTGCVYTGDHGGAGFTELDAPNFRGSFYSRTKLWSEQALADFGVLQLRIRMPIDSAPGPRNLISKLLQYDRLIDVPNSVTVVADFLRAARELMERNATGIYNVVNPGPITARQVMDIYNEISMQKKAYSIVSLAELAHTLTAPRSNCCLNTTKLHDFGIALPDAHTAVRRVMEAFCRERDG